MRRPNPVNEKSRFSGQIRHYHRAGTGVRRSWEEWVDGEGAKPAKWGKFLSVAGVALLLLAVGTIIAGLVITLR